VLGDDPFWRVSTLEEMEDFGQDAHLREDMKKNVARAIIEEVRVRKGLPIEVKVVEDAEKQRTLTKMK